MNFNHRLQYFYTYFYKIYQTVTRPLYLKDEEAKLLFQKVRVRREYEPLCEEYPIYVQFTQFGRSVHAKST